ncbi:MAG: exosortase C-terminal domain/associated protein EpsI [Candidatus Omnitrophota bacterium]
MNKNNLEKVVLICLLLTGMVLSFVFKPIKLDNSNDKRIIQFPQTIGEYTSTDVVLGKEVYDILETKNVIMRYYKKNAEPPILFYLIFSQQTHKTSDPPENCLTGDGILILQKSKTFLKLSNNVKLSVNKLITGSQDKKQVYLYWFLAGNQFVDSYITQRVKLIASYLMRKPLSGGQIRISTDIIEANETEALQRINAFISECLPLLVGLLS